MIRLGVFLALFCLTLGAEEEVYIESLAANIEKSGLLDNFSQSWRRHLDTWHAFHGRHWNDTNGTVSTSFEFNCNTNTSTNGSRGHRLESVSRLRPGDIGIIGALGASFVSGSGADATRLLEATLQYRGLSFPIGGDGNLSTTTTLPNILKEYNPRLRGWSRSIAPSWFEALSRLNVAVPGATVKDLDDQAKELIKRIKQMPGARDQWKMISIYIGMNDLCEACDKRIGGKASTYGRRIRDALDRLHKELTRTVVNLIALPPMHQWYRQLHDDPVCFAMHRYLCPCISNPKTDALAFEYNAELYKIPIDYERIDFTVVVQPFMSGKVQFPKTMVNGTEVTDQSYFAPDCFHFSRKGHAVAAAGLWSNLFQNLGEKDSTIDFSEGELSCPNDTCPYIRTWRNSRNCSIKLPVVDWTTLLPIIENMTWPDWNITENFTRPHFTGSWSDVFENFSRPHHWNWTVTWPHVLENITMRPWPRMMQEVPEASSTYSVAGTGWIAFGILLGIAVVGMIIFGYVDLKRRQRQSGESERTPLLTGSNVEKIY